MLVSGGNKIIKIILFLTLCSSIRSPCVKTISHQTTANNSQESKKFMAKTSSVHLHCASTKVVNISCRYFLLLLATLPCTTLQSPFLKTTRFLSRLALNRDCRNLKTKFQKLIQSQSVQKVT